MAKRRVTKKQSEPVVVDIWKPYIGSHDAPRYYGCEFTFAEKQLVYKAIQEKSGLNYVNSLMSNSMHAFGEAHNVPYCYTFGDDALVYCCIQLGIDYKKFPHNTAKLSVDRFVKLAKQAFQDFVQAANDIQSSVQRAKLVKLWFKWVADECEMRGCPYTHHSGCQELYEEHDLDKIADAIVANNRKRDKLLANIDVKPRGKSIKIANDALARIGVASRRTS